MTTEETREILRLVCAAYPTQRQRMQLRDLHAMLEVWSMALADIPFEMAKAAAARIVCSSKWLPSIAEFRAEIGELHHGARRAGIDAWGDIRIMRTYREREAMALCDPLVLHVCISLDWIKWRTLWRGGEDVEQWHIETGDHEPSDRARFAECYDKLTGAERKEGQLAEGGKIPARLPAREMRSLGDIVVGLLPEHTDS